MANIQTEQLIQEEIQKLPSYVQESLLTVDWQGSLEKVTERHHLHIDKLEQVRVETILVLIGLIEGSEFIKKIEDILDLSDDDMDVFVEELNNEVFLPMRTEILRRKDLQEDGTPESPKETPKPLSPFQQKLSQTMHSVQKQTDHSLQKEKPVVIDPYHEPID